MTREPYYIVFAGVNGAGKSTLFRTGLWLHGSIDEANALPRVNPDEIAVQHGWDTRSQSAQIKAGRIALKCIERHLASRESFNQETTLTGRSIMRNIRDARDAGFRIVMFYVGVDSPDIANERVAKRDALGGHFIPAETVTRRYDASLANLVEAIPLCEEAYLYDNSVKLELQVRFAHGVLLYCNPLGPMHPWVSRATESLGYFEIAF